MIDKIFDMMDRFSFGSNPFTWYWIPRFFKYTNVSLKDDLADEYGLFWMSIRLSIFANVAPYAQYVERRNLDRLKDDK